MDMTCWILCWYTGIPQYTLENTRNKLVIAGDTIARERQRFVGELEKKEGNLTLRLRDETHFACCNNDWNETMTCDISVISPVSGC